MSDNIGSVVMYLALGTYKQSARKAFDTPELKNIFQDLFTDAMNKECERMCKKSTGCVLRSTKPDELTRFILAKFDEEFAKMAPITYSVIGSLCLSKRSRRGEADRIIVATIASVVLQSRCPSMSALAYRIGILLRHAGTTTLVC